MKVLLDSNILIYSAAPEAENLQYWLGSHSLHVSAITELEVLGYHKLTEREHSYFSKFINLCSRIPIDQKVINKAVALRREKSMSLGDAIIAATAVKENLLLATTNTSDFIHISEIQLLNPMNSS